MEHQNKNDSRKKVLQKKPINETRAISDCQESILKTISSQDIMILVSSFILEVMLEIMKQVKNTTFGSFVDQVKKNDVNVLKMVQKLHELSKFPHESNLIFFSCFILFDLTLIHL